LTNRSFPDVHATSPNGRYRLDATSPDNANPDHWGYFQRSFRYVLTDLIDQTVVWEREQEGEQSPCTAFVSDDGDVVIRAGRHPAVADHLVFYTRGGVPRLKVELEEGFGASVGAEVRVRKPKRKRHRKLARIRRTDVVWRTGTLPPWFWPFASVVCFAPGGASNHFCLRLVSGRRLIVNLADFAILEDDAAEQAAALFAQDESAMSLNALRAPNALLLRGTYRQLGAILLAAEHRLEAASPFLRRLQYTPNPTPTSTCHVFGEGGKRSQNSIRATSRIALRILGDEATAEGNYGFVVGGRPARIAPSVGEPWRRALSAPIGSSPATVLATVGSPDFIEVRSEKVDRWSAHSESWDYDGPEETIRLVWSMPEWSDSREPQRLERIERIVPDWSERMLRVALPSWVRLGST